MAFPLFLLVLKAHSKPPYSSDDGLECAPDLTAPSHLYLVIYA